MPKTNHIHELGGQNLKPKGEFRRINLEFLLDRANNFREWRSQLVVNRYAIDSLSAPARAMQILRIIRLWVLQLRRSQLSLITSPICLRIYPKYLHVDKYT
jgi:hypothetical protein